MVDRSNLVVFFVEHESGGAAHALNGTAQKISDMVFIFTPSNVSLSVENGATQSKFAESLWNKPL